MQLNLSPKTTCLERPYFYGQCGGLSRQVLLYSLSAKYTSLIRTEYSGKGVSLLEGATVSTMKCVLFFGTNYCVLNIYD